MLSIQQQLDYNLDRGNTQVLIDILLSSLKSDENRSVQSLIKSSFGAMEETGLHIACVAGHNYLVSHLIELGSDVDATNKYDQTPLMKAARRGHKETISILVQAGASLLLQDKKGRHALDWAIFSADSGCIAILRKEIEDLVVPDILLYNEKIISQKTIATLNEQGDCSDICKPVKRDIDPNSIYNQYDDIDQRIFETYNTKNYDINIFEGIDDDDDTRINDNDIDFKISCALGCGQLKRNSQMEYHVKHRCPNREIACNICGSQIKVVDILTHENDHCPKRVVRCPYHRKGCDAYLQYEDVHRHISNTCQFRQLSFSKCGETISLASEQVHENDTCSYREVKFKDYELNVEAKVLKFHTKTEAPNDIRFTQKTFCQKQLITCQPCNESGVLFENLIHLKTKFCRKIIKKRKEGDMEGKEYTGNSIRYPFDLVLNRSKPEANQYNSNKELFIKSYDEGLKMIEPKNQELISLGSVGRIEDMKCSSNSSENTRHYEWLPKLHSDKNNKSMCTHENIKHFLSCRVPNKINIVEKHNNNSCVDMKNSMRPLSHSIMGNEHANSTCVLQSAHSNVKDETIGNKDLKKLRKNSVGRQTLICPQACGKNIFHKELIMHMSEYCVKRLVTCEQCGDKNIFAEDLSSHIDGSHRYLPCPSSMQKCDDCDFPVRLKEMNKHLLEYCPRRQVKCPLCNMSISFISMDDHTLVDCNINENMRNDDFDSLEKKNPHYQCNQCFHNVPLNEKYIHAQEKCPMRLIQCTHKCTGKIFARDKEIHELCCKQRILPCSISSSSCRRQIHEWIQSFDELNDFKFINCKKHNDNAFLWAIKNNDIVIFQFFLNQIKSLSSFKKSFCDENMIGDNPLIMAAKVGNIKIMLLIIQKAIIFDRLFPQTFSMLNFINVENSRGSTALIEAAKNNHVETIRILLTYYADIMYISRVHKKSALDWARAYKLNSSTLNEIEYAQKFQKDIRDLFICINTGNQEKMKRIIDSYQNNKEGFNIAQMKKDNILTLVLPCTSFGLEEHTISRLTSYVSQKGHTLLSWASAIGNLEAVKLLLDYGADNALGAEFHHNCACLIQLTFRLYYLNSPLKEYNQNIKQMERYRNSSGFQLTFNSILRRVKTRREFVRMPLAEALFNGHHEIVSIFQKKGLSLEQFGLLARRAPCGIIPRSKGATINSHDKSSDGTHINSKRNVANLINFALDGKKSFGTASWVYGKGWQHSGALSNGYSKTISTTVEVSTNVMKSNAELVRQKILRRECHTSNVKIEMLNKQLEVAIHRGDFETMMILASKNPDISLDFETPKWGLTPLMKATESYNLSTISTGGKIWLEEANEFVSPVSYLLDRVKFRPSIDFESDKSGHTALTYACANGKLKAVNELLQRCAQLNRRTRSTGMTGLMFAASQGQIDIVRLLLERNADTSLKDNSGKSAYDFAFQRHRDDILSLLTRQERNFNSSLLALDNVEKSDIGYKKYVPCCLGCGLIDTESNTKIHCATECKWRLVRCCHCKKEMRSFEYQGHIEVCNERLLKCPLCTNLIPYSNMSFHSKEYCIKRVVNCPNAPCKFKLRWENLEQHKTKSCEFRKVNCSNLAIGCDKVLSACDLACHLKHDCFYRTIRCSSCAMEVLFKNLDDHHKTTCSSRLEPCQICHEEVPMNQIKEHKEFHCESIRLACVNTGCVWFGFRNDMKNHDSHQCDYSFRIKCPLGCGLLLRNIDIRNHMKCECKKRQIECSKCGMTLIAAENGLHSKYDCTSSIRLNKGKMSFWS